MKKWKPAVIVVGFLLLAVLVLSLHPSGCRILTAFLEASGVILSILITLAILAGFYIIAFVSGMVSFFLVNRVFSGIAKYSILFSFSLLIGAVQIVSFLLLVDISPAFADYMLQLGNSVGPFDTPPISWIFYGMSTYWTAYGLSTLIFVRV